jgi:hypothetical protein
MPRRVSEAGSGVAGEPDSLMTSVSGVGRTMPIPVIPLLLEARVYIPGLVGNWLDVKSTLKMPKGIDISW